MRTSSPVLPDKVVAVLDGRAPKDHAGLTIQLVVCDDDSWPRVALLSVGEVLALSDRTLTLLLHRSSRTCRALRKTGRGILALTLDSAFVLVRVTVARTPKDCVTDPTSSGEQLQVTYFEVAVEGVAEDRAEYARLVSGIEFELVEADEVTDRWAAQVQLMRRLHAGNG